MKNIESIKEKIMEPEETKAKITIYKVMAYFFIYSIIGFIIETLFALIVFGVLESRRSTLYGPFCAIYGVGACVMLLYLNNLRKNKVVIFFGGMLIGSITEYLLSFFGELLMGVRWWDYSNMVFNLHGRICLAFTFFWGILAIFLVFAFNPVIDKILDKLKPKVMKIVSIICMTIIMVDTIITGFAISMFFTRFVCEKNIEVNNVESYKKQYETINSNKTLSYLSENVFTDEKILLTFPNMRFVDANKKIILAQDYFPGAKIYYYKIDRNK